MSRLSTSQHLIHQQLSIPSARPVHSELPEWLFNLPGVSGVVERLGVTEFRRRLFHMTPALLPIGLPLIPHQDVWGPALVTILYLLTASTLVLAVILGPLLTRTGERSWMCAVLGYMIPVISALVLFPGRAELGLMTLQILALGDGSATLGGMMLGGRRLPWNRKKTVSGLLCFTIVGSLAATYSFWGEARPGIPILTALVICTVSALCAAIVESLPMRSNDNLRVGTTALLVGITMSALVL
jgi:dolichol kinase